MKTRSRIIVTVISMVMVLAVMCVGIWAAASITVSSTGGSITFTSTDVFADVIVKQNQGSAKSFTFNETTTSAQNPHTVTLEDIDITIGQAGEVVNTVSIAITNSFATGGKNINVVFTAGTELGGTATEYLTLDLKGQTPDDTPVDISTLSTTGISIAPGDTVVIIAEVTLAANFDYQTDISANYNFAMNLTAAA